MTTRLSVVTVDHIIAKHTYEPFAKGRTVVGGVQVTDGVGGVVVTTTTLHVLLSTTSRTRFRTPKSVA